MNFLKDILPKNSNLPILKRGLAQQLAMRFPGDDEPTFVHDVMITLYENGIVFYKNEHETGTVHLTHCEITWRVKPFIPATAPAASTEPPVKTNVIPFMTRAEFNKRKAEAAAAPKRPDGAA